MAARSRISSVDTPAAAKIEKMFARGVSGGTVCDAARINPPPSAVIVSINRRVAIKNLFCCAPGEQFHGIQAAHKRQVTPVCLLQIPGIHSGAMALDRIQHVHSQEIRSSITGRTAPQQW